MVSFLFFGFARCRIIKLSLALLCASGAVSIAAQSYTWTHFAGTTGSSGTTDGAGNQARFNSPYGVAVDSSGNIYIADEYNRMIRKITPSGVVKTLAGMPGSWGNKDGYRSGAAIAPVGLAIDASGNLYVADSRNTIRKITPSGLVTTLAGLDGTGGSADGTGSAARFNYPRGIAADASGMLYVADRINHTIRMVTPAGVVTTLAGLAGNSGSADGFVSSARFSSPEGVAVDGAGNIYVSDTGNHTIRKIAPSGYVSTVAGLAGNPGSSDGTGSLAQFKAPRGMAANAAGDVYIADSGNHTIRRMTPTGEVTTLAGLAGTGGSSDGTGSSARFTAPFGLAIDGAGNLIVSEWFYTNNNTIRKVTPAGVVTTLAGMAHERGSADGNGNDARFYRPYGITTDGAGNVYIADTSNSTIRKITPAGDVTTLAGLAGATGSADGIGSAARFYRPRAIASDGAGNLVVADTFNHTIRAISPAGTVTTFAGQAELCNGADGIGTAAQFCEPAGVALGPAGEIYVADMRNNAIRKITSAGQVTTLAGVAIPYWGGGSADGTGSFAQFSFPVGLTVDSAGNIFVADSQNYTIRKVTPAGVVTTVAGMAGLPGGADGTGPGAQFNLPTGLARDGADNLYVTDTFNNIIRKVTSTGVVTTLAGVFQSQILNNNMGGADGTDSAARFSNPYGIALDSTGNIYIADTLNHSIRIGRPALADRAMIDSAIGAPGAPRQLDTSPQAATAWNWSLIRQPADSAATFSSSAIRNPVFTPDVDDLYEFRLVADGPVSKSITTVSLYAGCAPLIQSSPIWLRGVCAGSGASLSVTALGSPIMRYQWSKDDVPILGATAPTLTIASTTVTDSGSYTCTVTNGCGAAVSLVSTLVAVLPPDNVGNTQLITKQPSGLTIQWQDLINNFPNFSYTIYQDTAAGGTFSAIAGIVTGGNGGTVSLDLPMPTDNLLFFRIAASNSCGSGPK